MLWALTRAGRIAEWRRHTIGWHQFARLLGRGGWQTLVPGAGSINTAVHDQGPQSVTLLYRLLSYMQKKSIEWVLPPHVYLVLKGLKSLKLRSIFPLSDLRLGDRVF